MNGGPTTYAVCSRDEPADCQCCGGPLAGDNSTGICFQCSRETLGAKRVIILSGVSGTGKTYARMHDPTLKDLPYVDVADTYRENPNFEWQDATACLIRRVSILFKEHDVVVVEGYYLRGSYTRNWLVQSLKVAGVHNVDIRKFWAPIELCLSRITSQFEDGEVSAAQTERRIELLGKCWRPQPKE